MKNKQAIAVALLGVLVVIVVLYRQPNIRPNIPLPYFNKSQTPEEISAMSWSVFEKYLQYAKDHDVEGVASMSYKLGPICSDPAKIEECNALMDSAYDFGSNLTRENLTITYSDKNQIILVSEYERMEDDTLIGYMREIIYFTRDKKGQPKLLSFNHLDGSLVYKSKGVTTEEIEERLKVMLTDSDQDTLPDEVEACTDPNKYNACTNTDPNKKDSNGNGWWDSIERFFR